MSTRAGQEDRDANSAPIDANPTSKRLKLEALDTLEEFQPSGRSVDLGANLLKPKAKEPIKAQFDFGRAISKHEALEGRETDLMIWYT